MRTGTGAGRKPKMRIAHADSADERIKGSGNRLFSEKIPAVYQGCFPHRNAERLSFHRIDGKIKSI